MQVDSLDQFDVREIYVYRDDFEEINYLFISPSITMKGLMSHYDTRAIYFFRTSVSFRTGNKRLVTVQDYTEKIIDIWVIILSIPAAWTLFVESVR